MQCIYRLSRFLPFQVGTNLVGNSLIGTIFVGAGLVGNIRTARMHNCSRREPLDPAASEPLRRPENLTGMEEHAPILKARYGACMKPG